MSAPKVAENMLWGGRFTRKYLSFTADIVTL